MLSNSTHHFVDRCQEVWAAAGPARTPVPVALQLNSHWHSRCESESGEVAVPVQAEGAMAGVRDTQFK